MHIFGFPQYKYVYPTIMLVGLLLFLMMRYASGADTTPPVRPEGPRDGMEFFRNSENEFIDASERFNSGLRSNSALETRIQRQDDRIRDLERGWRNASPGYYSKDTIERMNREYENDLYIDNDNRYSMERRQLDNIRSKELNEYRDRRQEIQNSMVGYNRSSSEYERLERQLNDLDRRHAEEERKFEREFRNMDANYSLTR